MVYLQAMGPDGQRILDNDELQIDDTTNVVYRVGQEFIIRGHEILYRGSASTAPDLDDPAYWEAKFGLFRAEGTRIKERRLARSAVYQAMNDLQRHGPAGQRVLDSDELYIAAPFDVRFRRKGGPQPRPARPLLLGGEARILQGRVISPQFAPAPHIAHVADAKDILLGVFRKEAEARR